MLTMLISALVLALCTAARWYLDRPGRRERSWAGDRVRLCTLWNSDGAFGLRVKRPALLAASGAALWLLWLKRKGRALSAGLALGGGLSNLLERLRHGKVFDYLRFPKSPGRLKRYVFNLADFALVLGCIGLLLPRKRR